MELRIIFVSCIVALCTVTSTTATFSCFDCNSITQSNCADQFNSDQYKSSSTMTSSGCEVCLKLEGNSILVRRCISNATAISYGMTKNQCKDSVNISPYGNVMACTCDSQFCNSGESIKTSVLVLVVMAMYVLVSSCL